MHEELRRDIGREVVPGAGIGYDDLCLDLIARTIRWSGGCDGNGHGLLDHGGIVNAAPEMAPLRHMAVLALRTLGSIRALAPLVVGIFEQLAVTTIQHP